MLLADFISNVPLCTVINIECNGEVIDSFTAEDFISKNKYTRNYYYRGVKSIDINGKYNLTVHIMQEAQFGVKKELICYKDGSYTLDKKPFTNIDELIGYLIKCNY